MVQNCYHPGGGGDTYPSPLENHHLLIVKEYWPKWHIIFSLICQKQHFLVYLQEIESHKSIRGKTLQRQVTGFAVLGSLLIVFAIAALTTLKFVDHLSWTILSNNFVLIVATVTSAIIMKRIDSVIALIR